MTIWDDRILEYIQQNEGAGRVGELAESDYIRVSGSHVSRRCRKLVEHGLLRDLGNGVYQITDRGEAYLRGELDASEDTQDDPIDVEGREGSSRGTEENST